MHILAIGYSTNLITQDSNLIVIRGGDPTKGGRSVYEQLYAAAKEFFPDSAILDEHGIQNKEQSSKADDEDRNSPLRRVNTGFTSIVGGNNGDRPGGFVLVIEGTPLGFVSPMVVVFDFVR